jgi:hypothetical protein
MTTSVPTSAIRRDGSVKAGALTIDDCGTAYSYATCIGTLAMLPTGEVVYLLNGYSYSRTTAAHKRRATNHLRDYLHLDAVRVVPVAPPVAGYTARGLTRQDLLHAASAV